MESMENEKQVDVDGLLKETSIGVLADFRGTGKTLTVLALISRNRMQWDMETPHVVEKLETESGGLIKTHIVERYTRCNSTLVLVSSALVHQWVEELNKTNLNHILVTRRRHIEAADVDSGVADVILVTPNVFNLFCTHHADLAWRRFVFDEPGHERVTNMRTVVAGFYWLVTASPHAMVVQHRNCNKGSFMKEVVLQNVHTSDDFDRVFSGLIVRNERFFVEQSFNQPATRRIFYKCRNPLFSMVRSLVSDEIGNMLEASNIEGVIEILGGSKTDNLVQLLKDTKSAELERLVSQVDCLEREDDYDDSHELIHQQIQILQKQLDQIDDAIESMISADCPICLKQMQNPVLETNCQNLFCAKCLLKWIGTRSGECAQYRTCPLCRREVHTKNLIYVTQDQLLRVSSRIEDGDNTVGERVERLKTKEETIVEIISTSPALSKFIIFSAFEESFTLIRNVLSEHSISFVEVKGVVSSRKNKLNSYRFGDKQVLFLNSNYNGSGLNLMETTDIILYHRMSPNTISQVVGSVARIGREMEIRVHMLEVDE
jgi:SNF2 family DNA or RNA helicase